MNTVVPGQPAHRRIAGTVGRRLLGAERFGRLRGEVPVTPPPVVAPREPRWSACYAPHTSVYFDQLGKARACCQNTGTYLGDVTQQSIREIWSSASAEAMRTALEADDYGEGCGFCAWQVEHGDDEILFSRQYDGLQPVDHRPAWPIQMEFALTNTCNLQCVMCNGEWSSMIRSRREHLPPLPVVYNDAFFEQLAEFLPHLEAAKFAGGEPFLGHEPLRVLEMLAELDDPPEVTIITNATTWTPRVERLVERLRPRIIVSIDGATPETYDGIRIGAHLPDVLANVDRFIERLGADRVSTTTCLMTRNWREFSAILGLAEDRGLAVGVNVVHYPEGDSLYRLAPDELRPILEALDEERPALTKGRLAAWVGHRDALRHHLHSLERATEQRVELRLPHDDPAIDGIQVAVDPENPDPPSSRFAWLPFPEEGGSQIRRDDPELPTDGVALLTISLDGRIAVERADPDAPVDVDDLDGDHVDALDTRLSVAFPELRGWRYQPRHAVDDDDRFELFLGPMNGQPTAVLVGTSIRDLTGALTGGRFAFLPSSP